MQTCRSEPRGVRAAIPQSVRKGFSSSSNSTFADLKFRWTTAGMHTSCRYLQYVSQKKLNNGYRCWNRYAGTQSQHPVSAPCCKCAISYCINGFVVISDWIVVLTIFSYPTKRTPIIQDSSINSFKDFETHSRARAVPRAIFTRAFHVRRFVFSSLVWSISLSVPRFTYWYTSSRCPCSAQ